MRFKLFTCLIAVLLLILAACGNASPDNSAIEELNSRITELERENRELREALAVANIAEEPDAEQPPEKTEEAEEAVVFYAEATVTDKVVAAWKSSPSSKYTEAHGAAEITNTGTLQVYINRVTFDFEDASGKLIASESASIGICPVAIEPGMSACVSVGKTMDGSINPDEIVNVEVTVDYEEVYYEANQADSPIAYLLVEEITVGKRSDYTNIVGRVVNPYDFDVEGYDVAVAIYDEEDKLLGVFWADSRDTLKAGAKVGFETFYPAIEIEDYYKKAVKSVGFATNRLR